MENKLLIIFWVGLFVPTILFGAQEQELLSAVEQKSLHKIVQEYAHQFKKTVHCAWGVKGCSQEDIDNARILVGKIIGGIVVLTGGTLIIKKSLSNEKKGWFEVPQPVLPSDVKNILEQNSYAITDKVYDEIILLMENDRHKARRVYNWLVDAANKQQVQFSSPVYDEKLWIFLKNREFLIQVKQDGQVFIHGTEEEIVLELLAPRRIHHYRLAFKNYQQPKKLSNLIEV